MEIAAIDDGAGALSSQSYGTSVTWTDNARSTANELLHSAKSGDVTPSGTPAGEKPLLFRFSVRPTGTTHAEKVRVARVHLFFPTNRHNDD